MTSGIFQVPTWHTGCLNNQWLSSTDPITEGDNLFLHVRCPDPFYPQVQDIRQLSAGAQRTTPEPI